MAPEADLSYLFHHVFLPPKLPQEDDGNASKDLGLMAVCKAALTEFQTHLLLQEREKCQVCTKMLGVMLDLRCTGSRDMSAASLQKALRGMLDQDVIALEIKANNSGILIRKTPTSHTVESFELSPTNDKVMGTQGRLLRCFPGPVIELSPDRMSDQYFCQAFADLMVKLDSNTPEEAVPQVSKAGSKVKEIRDTTHPKFVTEMLTGFLRALGEPSQVVRIHKRLRDDVLWNSTLKPWRRSSLWLLLRVALQTTLLEGVDDHSSYKSFMVFFMAYLLEKALNDGLASEKLFIMTVKINRRVQKLALDNDPAWMKYVYCVVEKASEELERKWRAKEQNTEPLELQKDYADARLSFSTDTELSLNSLRPHLAGMLTRPPLPFHDGSFTPILQSRVDPHNYHSAESPEFSDSLALFDIESWVQESLQAWLEIYLQLPPAPIALSDLIKNYSAAAQARYQGNAEGCSRMFLTLMELWVALDKCVTHQYPLLGEYQPPFPPSLFRPFLLPKQQHMERLSYVEQYIEHRMGKAKHASALVFENVNSITSFGVRYVHGSPSHQELRREIEADAHFERTSRKRELLRNKSEYSSLISRYEATHCQYQHEEPSIQNDWTRVSRHSQSCRRCVLKDTADKLQIKVHEWPLPRDDSEANAAVFELDVPTEIATWRHTTFSLLIDVFSPKLKGASPISGVWTIARFSGLSKYHHSRGGRLQFASNSKPFVVSHYRQQWISIATEGSICVENGLHYAMRDSVQGKYTCDLLGHCDVEDLCTFRLPHGLYANLQFALQGTTHTSNDILAKQSECAGALDLHEFYSFGILRAGHRLQWRNLARELTSRVLNFSSEETYLLVLQTIWQAGPPGVEPIETVCRESHRDCTEEGFAIAMISALNKAVDTVEGNWQNAVAIRIFVALATRLLSLSPHKFVHERCYEFLRRARSISRDWARELSTLIHEEENPKQLETLNFRVLEIALTCHSTFDVDNQHLSSLLGCNEDVADLGECCILVQSRCPTVTSCLPVSLQALLLRFDRLAHFIESHLREQILRNGRGLNTAVRRVWAGYRPGMPWTALPTPNERWVTTTTSGDMPLTVHYNVLDGTLRVNGSLLSRLGPDYEAHTIFRQLFGNKIFDVIPSTMTGMVYETRNEIRGQQVHFRIHGSDLIIRTKREAQVYEIVPQKALQEDFPRHFIEDYVHWQDVTNKSIQWRPLGNVWESSAAIWQMQAFGLQRYVLARADKPQKLVDFRSITSRIISTLLSPIEQPTHIHIVLDDRTGALEIHLPRMKLDFLLRKSGSPLESKQFHGMVVDEHQSFGAFTGLRNKLVLRSSHGVSRCVIIPHGTVSFRQKNDRVYVKINTDSLPSVKYHMYRIDTRLGRLDDNGSLQSRLYRLYLHALTSNCLCDGLTGRTGTEEALAGLKEAATRSFVSLEPTDMKILEQIGKLTPCRQFYPTHLRVMQQVDYNDLPSLSQHCAFQTQVASIFDYAASLQVFQERPDKLRKPEPRSDQRLLDRAALRQSSFQVHGFGAETFTPKHDQRYDSRDYGIDTERESRTCSTARLVDDWSTDLTVSQDLLRQMQAWNQPVQGQGSVERLKLGFDLQWLADSSKIFSKYWFRLTQRFSRSVAARDKYEIMVFLSTLSYSLHANPELIETLLAFATNQHLRQLRNPLNASTFELSHGFSPDKLKMLALAEGRPFDQSRESQTQSHPVQMDSRRRRQELFAQALQAKRQAFVENLLKQWPRAKIATPCDQSGYDIYIYVSKAMTAMHSWFSSWLRNAGLQRYIGEVQDILSSMTPCCRTTAEYTIAPSADLYSAPSSSISFADLTKNSAPRCPEADRGSFDTWVAQKHGSGDDHSKMKELLSRISSSSSTGYQKLYAEDLFQSFTALQKGTTVELRRSSECKEVLEKHLEQALSHMKTTYDIIRHALKASVHAIAIKTGMLPRLSPVSILSHLAHDKVGDLPQDWKVAFVQYALSIAEVQRAERLLATFANTPQFLAELKNAGHQNWDPIAYPEWLLLEIENNILIRDEQARISKEMISPSSDANSVMQLNMGLGKSSVIVPIVAAALANGKQLTRVIVLKPLAMQMFRSLVEKLGGLISRRVCFMPISRSLDSKSQQARQIRKMYKECMRTGAVILLQPEHILSFELMGFDHLLAGRTDSGNTLNETQEWLYANTRDILDESDEILSVRFELIYTIGLQRAIDYSPERWSNIQRVLGHVARVADQVLKQHPHGLEIVPSVAGGFPRIRIVQTKAGDELLLGVASAFFENGLPGVPICFLSPTVKSVLFDYLTDDAFDPTDSGSLLESVFASESAKNGLLLLRGLFACGILKFSLGHKRWRVNYGLDLTRSLLAVPYHAKDTPATRAEFSHPDATMVLTSLSYYYAGLKPEEITLCFEALLKSDQAKEEYERWVKDAPGLDRPFRNLGGINLSNKGQCLRDVFPPLRFAKAVIDFYLSTIVFPKSMKEFPHKLSSSGWDVAREKEHPTTGFSGTNDSRYMLPLSISQCDLPEQLSTNALVLDCLLRSKNSFTPIEKESPTGELNAKILLKVVLASQPPVRVILDVGAQVLELKNQEVAEQWLSQVEESKAQAVIFFDDDELCVLSRDGAKESLVISPFAEQMDQCLVYLDECHTRGTDLKLPSDYRAMVTLGPGLTKDRVAQACMRMRKLGDGQSITFCASMEIQLKILECNGKSQGPIEVLDVLKWCIDNTRTYTRKCIPLWATQGLRHQHRRAVESAHRTVADRANSLLEPEAQSLEERYSPSDGERHQTRVLSLATSETLATRLPQVRKIESKCAQFGNPSFSARTMHEEQERELSPEAEREQQVELPPALSPCSHRLHPDLKNLVATGLLANESSAVQPAFEVLTRTTANQFYDPKSWPAHLLVTKDYASTVRAAASQPLDSFLRPVHWVLSFYQESGVRLLIISPYEAQELVPALRKQDLVILHIYAPRLSLSVRTLEDLSVCTVPRVSPSRLVAPLSQQLNLFAGQLYFRTYDDYESLCAFLGLSSQEAGARMEVSSDGFVSPATRVHASSNRIQNSPFRVSPVAFVRKIMALRRKGKDFAGSHIGRILNGELITKEDFETRWTGDGRL